MPKITKPCAVCGLPFTNPRSWAKTCGTYCQMLYVKKRQQEYARNYYHNVTKAKRQSRKRA